MQLVAFTSAALFAATSLASASPDLLTNALKLLQTANDACNIKNPNIKIVNTCDYPVHLWSISKNDVCSGSGLVLQQGDYYQENYRPAVGKTAVSIKLSKSEECDCTKTDITQVEYMIETVGSKRDGVAGNFHDVSFVDCNTFGGKCPGRDGFYLKTGNVNGQWMSSANNEHCPILNCNSKSECATMAYVNPDDVQTKWCQAQANMEFHICGQNSTSGNTQPAASSKQVAASSVAAPSSAAPSSSQAPVSAAAYTPVVTPSPAAYTPNVHTQVVYTTVEVEVEAKKRHVGRHAHRHQHFHA